MNYYNITNYVHSMIKYYANRLLTIYYLFINNNTLYYFITIAQPSFSPYWAPSSQPTQQPSSQPSSVALEVEMNYGLLAGVMVVTGD